MVCMQIMTAEYLTWIFIKRGRVEMVKEKAVQLAGHRQVTAQRVAEYLLLSGTAGNITVSTLRAFTQ